MRIPPLATLAAAILASACSTPPPPAAVDSPSVRIRAGDPRSAARVAVLAESLLPRVRAVLPAARQATPVIWVQETLDPAESGGPPESGYTLLDSSLQARRIHLLASESQAPWTLAHELTHFLMGPEWGTLPGVLAEGVADHVAAAVLPEQAADIRAGRLLRASTWLDGMPFLLEVGLPVLTTGGTLWGRGRTPLRFRSDGDPTRYSLAEILALNLWTLNRRKDEPGFPSYHGLGFLLVARIQRRIGLAGLYTLCRAAEAEGLEVVPADRVLAAAGVGEGGLAAAWAEEMASGDVERIAVRRAPALAGLLLRFARNAPGATGMDPGAWLDGASPRFSLRDGSAAVVLDTLPGLRSLLAEEWPWEPVP